ncbi:MAG: hemerythrin domain-containing protein [Acidimicrobiia bacterium]
MAVIDTITPSTYELVAVDTYRDIHKGIRADLFALTGDAGRIDPSCAADVGALAAHVDATVAFLVTHAEHEDAHVGPAMAELLPDLAATIERDHAVLEGRLVDLQAWAGDAVTSPAGATRGAVQRLYVELASFTSAYLAHQDLEERIVAPELHRVLGAEGVLAIHQAIIASIPPDEMATSLAIMLPAMNNDDRTELLGGMQAGAPPEVFAGVWSLAGSVLEPRDVAVLARRLGV